jgi:hypothetical protein
LVLLALLQSGCSLFFGSIKPVEEKSTTYGVMDLSKTNPDWLRLDGKTQPESTEAKDPDTRQTSIADVAFQSKKTASIISLNSACKNYAEPNEKQENLKELTRELLLGISDISFHEEQEIFVNRIPALQTTVVGKLGQENMKLRTVVLQRTKCVYDLMYVSRPEKFPTHEDEFSNFVTSLMLK